MGTLLGLVNWVHSSSWVVKTLFRSYWKFNQSVIPVCAGLSGTQGLCWYERPWLLTDQRGILAERTSTVHSNWFSNCWLCLHEHWHSTSICDTQMFHSYLQLTCMSSYLNYENPERDRWDELLFPGILRVYPINGYFWRYALRSISMVTLYGTRMILLTHLYRDRYPWSGYKDAHKWHIPKYDHNQDIAWTINRNTLCI